MLALHAKKLVLKLAKNFLKTNFYSFAARELWSYQHAALYKC